eukprot:scaffold4402_cov338-Prasinococcus_capsulatus_cf.AAC.3
MGGHRLLHGGQLVMLGIGGRLMVGVVGVLLGAPATPHEEGAGGWGGGRGGGGGVGAARELLVVERVERRLAHDVGGRRARRLRFEGRRRAKAQNALRWRARACRGTEAATQVSVHPTAAARGRGREGRLAPRRRGQARRRRGAVATSAAHRRLLLAWRRGVAWVGGGAAQGERLQSQEVGVVGGGEGGGHGVLFARRAAAAAAAVLLRRSCCGGGRMGGERPAVARRFLEVLLHALEEGARRVVQLGVGDGTQAVVRELRAVAVELLQTLRLPGGGAVHLQAARGVGAVHVEELVHQVDDAVVDGLDDVERLLQHHQQGAGHHRILCRRALGVAAQEAVQQLLQRRQELQQLRSCHSAQRGPSAAAAAAAAGGGGGGGACAVPRVEAVPALHSDPLLEEERVAADPGAQVPGVRVGLVLEIG